MSKIQQNEYIVDSSEQIYYQSILMLTIIQKNSYNNQMLLNSDYRFLKNIPISYLQNYQHHIKQATFNIQDPHQLYFYILQNNKLTSTQIQNILMRSSDHDIIKLLISKNFDLITILLNVNYNQNIWIIIKYQAKVDAKLINYLLSAYFNPNQITKYYDTEHRQDQQKIIKKKIFDSLKEILLNQKFQKKQLINIFQNHYLSHTDANDLHKSQDKLKIIQLLFSNHPYRKNGYLQLSDQLKTDIMNGLMNPDSLYSNLLALNIYGQIIKIRQEQNIYVHTFVNLYSTLNSYGVHLIKDVWDQFTILTNSNQHLSYISIQKQVQILLVKVWKHKNENIAKHCIKFILKSDKINRLNFIKKYRNIVYEIFIKILNSGHFYLDCPLQNDSKFFSYVSNFFCQTFLLLDQSEMEQNLKEYLNAIYKHVHYDQSLPAFFLVFKKLKKRSNFFGSQQIIIIIKILNKVYGNIHMRKRWQIIDSILDCMSKHLAHIPFSEAAKIVEIIPQQAFSWKFIYDDAILQQLAKNKIDLVQYLDNVSNQHYFLLQQRLKYIITHKFKQQQIIDYLKQLREQAISNPNVINQFYKLVNIGNFIQYPSISQNLEELSKSCYSKKIQIQILLKHLYCLNKDKQFKKSQIQQIFSIIIDYINRFHKDEGFHHHQVLQIVKNISNSVFKNIQKVIGEQVNHYGRKEIAKFTQWIIYTININNQNGQLIPLMFQFLLEILMSHCKHKQIQYFIQDSLYELNQKIDTIYLPKQKKLLGIKLRIELFLSLLLKNDPSYDKNYKFKQFIEEPISLIERYDFHHYSQVLYFFEQKYLDYILVHNQFKQFQYTSQYILKSITCNLQYSITKLEVTSLCNFIFNKKTLLCQPLLKQKHLQNLFKQIIKVGNEVWLFHRCTIDIFYKVLTQNYNIFVQKKLLKYFTSIFYTFIEMEQYRGFDGQVNFWQQQTNIINVIDIRYKIPYKGQYFGSYPRILFMNFFEKILRNKQSLQSQEQFFIIELIKKILTLSIKDSNANKMLFTQPFRIKLRHWQFLQILVPFFQKPSDILLKQQDGLFKQFEIMLQQNNQPHVKHYIQLFITRVILYNPKRWTKIIIKKLQQPSNNLNQTITYIIITGLILQKEFNSQLYSVLLTFICTNTAYIRGLTQYFCFYNFITIKQYFTNNQIIMNLYQQYRQNPDSLRLVYRIQGLVNQYSKNVKNWSFDYFCSLNFYKAGQIVQQYHMDTLKRIGLEIVKQIKNNEQGYIPFKQLWKQDGILGHQIKIQQQIKSFQRKIDPILEDIYEFNQKTEAKTKLKILASNLQELHNYGHLVRTSQIFSVEQLAIENIKIIEQQKFKSVSCTGQKWLNIIEIKRINSRKYILDNINNGYKIFTISNDLKQGQFLKSIKLPEKCLLVLPNQKKQLQVQIKTLIKQKLYVGGDLSIHVEAAIFIWQYVLNNLLKK